MDRHELICLEEAISSAIAEGMRQGFETMPKPDKPPAMSSEPAPLAQDVEVDNAMKIIHSSALNSNVAWGTFVCNFEIIRRALDAKTETTWIPESLVEIIRKAVKHKSIPSAEALCVISWLDRREPYFNSLDAKTNVPDEVIEAMEDIVMNVPKGAVFRHVFNSIKFVRNWLDQRKAGE